MNCTNCQAVLEEGTTVCPNCGRIVELETMNNQENQQQGYQQQGYAQYRGPVPMPQHVRKSLITLLICSVIEFACCNQLGAGLGFIFTILARESFLQADFAKFEKRKKYATYSLVGGIIMTALCGVAYGMLSAFFGFVGF